MTTLFAIAAAAVLAYTGAALATLHTLRDLAALTAADRRTAALAWPWLFLRTIGRRHRYARIATAADSAATRITMTARLAGYPLAPDARELVDAFRAIAHLPKFGVFARDVASGASFAQPTEPALARIRAAQHRAAEIYTKDAKNPDN
ncbi:uncharacterized protein (DUF2126 family) [Nocardia sp. GP40]|uniref:hypothetical protein n=1 Tax=Nocardia sp. GP40 TaxID=3156268 RepID=UPI003D2539FE